jgi:3-hydroxyacyl-[acyl-carrier-protein] dehydratase
MRLEYFEMIDRVEEIDADAGTIRARSRLPDKSPVFDGHFPGFPTLPGVLMLEMINHVAGYVIARRHNLEKFVFLGGVKRAKFRRFIRPGDAAEITARVTHDGSGYAVAEGTISIDGQVAADAEIIMIVTGFPSPELAASFKRFIDLIPVAAPAGV